MPLPSAADLRRPLLDDVTITITDDADIADDAGVRTGSYVNGGGDVINGVADTNGGAGIRIGSYVNGDGDGVNGVAGTNGGAGVVTNRRFSGHMNGNADGIVNRGFGADVSINGDGDGVNGVVETNGGAGVVINRGFSGHMNGGADVIVNGRFGGDVSINGDSDVGNPYEFVGAEAPAPIPLPSTVDPFRNHTPTVRGVYEWGKMIITVPLAIVRLVLFGLAIGVGFVVTKLALLGWKDMQSPMPRWRSAIMLVTRLCSRCILFSFGYHWIRRIGRPASREIAPIVVSNHVSFVEPIFFFYELFPTIVASESHDAMPLVGTIIRAMQVIYVDRFSAQSRKLAVNEIKRKASCNRFPRLLLFPEATTTNGRALISFQLGAFIPGVPVQPVVVRYPYVHFDHSWGNVSLASLMFRMFTQFHNFMEVEYLPIIVPQESKQENAVKFAEQTRCAMASALNVVETPHTYGDVMLLTRAAQLRKDNGSNYMVEMACESAFNISTSEAMVLLDQFIAMTPDSNGRVRKFSFLSAFGLSSSSLSEKIFRYFDVEKKGYITFRQFVLVSAHIRKGPLFWEACDTAFSIINNTGTRHITVDELGHIFQSLEHDMSGITSHIFGMMDTDNDGAVSRDNFIAFLHKNPLLIALFAQVSKIKDSVFQSAELDGDDL